MLAGLLLSVPFFITTFVLYAMTPSLRDVHGKALMSEVLCQAVAYTTLAAVQLWGSYLNQGFCFAIGQLTEQGIPRIVFGRTAIDWALSIRY